MRTKEKGVALIVVLWIAMLLVLTLYSFLLETAAETSLANGFAARKKAEQLALSGYEKAIVLLDADEETKQTLADAWAHDEDEWFEVELGDGVFTLIHPIYSDDQVYWGIADEASRLNINTAPKDSLLELPEMTEEIADSILDWRDSDNEPEPSGAEEDYYITLQPPYSCRNAPFVTVEELLFVKGMTAEILWGEDRNQNGILDPGEDDDGDGELDFGFANFVTVYSVDKNVQKDGSDRLNINDPQADLENGLAEVLSAGTIQAIRTSGPYLSVGYLLDVQGVTVQSFKQVVDLVTVLPAPMAGMININTAPKQVLSALPGIEDEMVEALLSYRSREEVDLSNIGWVLDVELDEEMKKEQLKTIANHVTTRSYQFRIDSVGRVGERVEESLSDDGETPFAFKRILAIYDKLQDPPRPVYFRDISSRGFPYNPWEKPQSP
jgi:type II secretory pathway component PulK